MVLKFIQSKNPPKEGSFIKFREFDDEPDIIAKITTIKDNNRNVKAIDYYNSKRKFSLLLKDIRNLIVIPIIYDTKTDQELHILKKTFHLVSHLNEGDKVRASSSFNRGRYIARIWCKCCKNYV